VRAVIGIVVAVALLSPSSSDGEAFQETCVQVTGTPVGMQIIQGQLIHGDVKLWNNMWGMRGYKNDNLEQCLFTDGADLGWTWIKGTTDPVCCAPGSQRCPAPACMYQFSIPSLNYGVDPWGNTTGAADLPVNVGNLQSLVVSHDITYVATDDTPGSPGPIYARHSLVYDLFLTTEEPAAGTDVSTSITDEMLIFLHYNPEYPDIEACSSTMNDPIEPNAVFDGFNSYDYHAFSPFNVIGQNYHQFRLVGGDLASTPIPQNVDLAPFLRYIKKRHDQPDLWVGKIVMGTQLYDHTTGSATFHGGPTFAVESCECPQIADATCTTGFAKGALLIEETVPGKEKFLAKLTKGPQLARTDMGNPMAVAGGTTSYSLCIYDENSDLVSSMCVDRAGDTCGGRPCWKSLRGDPPNGKGYFYKDTAADSGITKLLYKSASAGRSKVIITGRGSNIPSGIAAALQSSTQATIQLRSSDAQCLSVTLSDVKRNDADSYKIK
jgi:hypothetical protein